MKQEPRVTWRLWLAIDIVTTKLDRSMGGTLGAGCEGEAGESSASAAAGMPAAAESSLFISATAAVVGGDAASFDMRRR